MWTLGTLNIHIVIQYAHILILNDIITIRNYFKNI